MVSTSSPKHKVSSEYKSPKHKVRISPAPKHDASTSPSPKQMATSSTPKHKASKWPVPRYMMSTSHAMCKCWVRAPPTDMCLNKLCPQTWWIQTLPTSTCCLQDRPKGTNHVPKHGEPHPQNMVKSSHPPNMVNTCHPPPPPTEGEYKPHHQKHGWYHPSSHNMNVSTHPHVYKPNPRYVLNAAPHFTCRPYPKYQKKLRKCSTTKHWDMRCTLVTSCEQVHTAVWMWVHNKPLKPLACGSLEECRECLGQKRKPMK